MPGRAIFALGAAVLLSGCATLFASKSKELSLISDPQGAEVYINGSRVGVTPMNFRVDNNKPQTVTFRKAGHKEVSCHLTTKTGAGWIVLDVLAGLVPVIIDAATGDWKQLDGSSCSVALPPAEGA